MLITCFVDRNTMFETTAAQARLEAPNLATAETIDENAEKEHQAAMEAARVAQVSILSSSSPTLTIIPDSQI